MKIIRDTREKHGWDFPDYEVADAALKIGDYSIETLENFFVIERKGSISELAGNIVEDRFVRELQKMKDIQYKFLLFEFSMHDLLYYPQTADIPQKYKDKIKLDGNFILRRISEYQFDYDVNILFCDNRQNAQKVAISLFKRAYERAAT